MTVSMDTHVGMVDISCFAFVTNRMLYYANMLRHIKLKI